MSALLNTLDGAALKKRLVVMLAVNAVAVIAAGAALVGYFKLGLGWALVGFVAAMAVGFVAQIWFIAGLLRPVSSDHSPARGTHAGRGA